MKRISVLLLVLLAGASCWLSARPLPANADDAPEFFFTRLAYTEDGYRGFGRNLGNRYVCPEFGGGNFFPPQGLGWSMDSPGADCKFMGGVHRLTGLSVFPNPNMVEITADD